MKKEKKSKEKKVSGLERKKAVWGIVFVLPSIILFSIFSFYPIGYAFFVSLYKKELLSLESPKFIGLRNYVRLLESDSFWNSVIATLKFAVGTFVPMVVFSLLLATFILGRKRFQKLFQVVYYSPAIMQSAVAALVWLIIFDPRSIANQFMNFILNTKGVDYKWLVNENMLVLSTIIVYFWKYIGYFTVLFLAGLASIPREIHEAARIDGANRFQDFIYITLPLLKPTTTLVSVVAMIQCLRTFSTQYLFVQAGASVKPIEVITLNIYHTAIRDRNIGRASAMSVLLFIVIMILTIIQLRVSRSEEVQY
ncbi:sugar ABC transporter permease [Fervidobacterium riparium]|uniref:ABC-type sugar transport system, permease component n=1 Tax=Fervidobacterium gondwanense DSM 13020 TaxID=1121883 RepID=A0A1M7SQ29_FERGO|nr:sugar ABC transporter permease [Fervidobacterium gondwanense]UXF00656.1 ABC transporter permease [Fervidobacterium riparium]SHN60508.1 ABC-type sugar transport system, permease component [Fervidobacterium gondwanense DSM 13020]